MSWDSSFTPFWPVKKVRDLGLYFYSKSVEEYIHGMIVRVPDYGEMIMFGSYSYLGLNQHTSINDAAVRAIEKYGTGTHGVRQLSGTLEVHKQLENTIANFKKTEAATTFSSGYIANVSTIAAISNSKDIIFCDKLNHASILDGCMLSHAKLCRFKHNDLNHLERLMKAENGIGKKIVVVDAIFSMTGDLVNLPELVKLCESHGAILMVDEAHSLGVIGDNGRGIVQHFNLQENSVQIYMGSMGKTIPSVGGYIASSKKMCEFLAHTSRGYIYSASLPPSATAASNEAFHVLETEQSHYINLRKNIDLLKALLQIQAIPCTNEESAIFPIVIGDELLAWEVAAECQARGIYIQAIPYPVVPKGEALLRATVTASHTKADLEYFVEVVGSVYKSKVK